MRLILAGCALCVLASSLGAQMGDPTHETTTPDVLGLTAETSKCALSTDPSYGLTIDNPIKIGGGAMYTASRQVKFLSALRGPAGEGVHFKRTGSKRQPDETFLDLYSVDMKGDRKTTLYLDGYHWSDPMAPRGFLCGAPMNLMPPGPDPFETTRQLTAYAISLGATEVAPISMDGDGSKAHGVIYDHVRLIAVAAHAAAASLDPDKLPQSIARPHLVVIATPLVCEGETIDPESVRLQDGAGNEPKVLGAAAGAKIADLSPGLVGPADAVAIAYAVPELIAGARTTVHYRAACRGKQDVELPVTIAGPRILSQAPAPPPPGRTVPPDGAKVVMQIFVAPDGSALHPAFVSGAFEFTAAAAESLKNWKFEPARANTAPVYKAEKVMVVVK